MFFLSRLVKQVTSYCPFPIGHSLLFGHIVNITFICIIHILNKYLLGAFCVHSTLLGLKKTQAKTKVGSYIFPGAYFLF